MHTCKHGVKWRAVRGVKCARCLFGVTKRPDWLLCQDFWREAMTPARHLVDGIDDAIVLVRAVEGCPEQRSHSNPERTYGPDLALQLVCDDHPAFLFALDEVCVECVRQDRDVRDRMLEDASEARQAERDAKRQAVKP